MSTESAWDKMVRECLQQTTTNPKLKNLKPVEEMTQQERMEEVGILVEELNSILTEDTKKKTNEDVFLKLAELSQTTDISVMTTTQIADKMGMAVNELMAAVFNKDVSEIPNESKNEMKFDKEFVNTITKTVINALSDNKWEGDTVTFNDLLIGFIYPIYHYIYESNQMLLSMEDDFVEAGVNAQDFREGVVTYIDGVNPRVELVTSDAAGVVNREHLVAVLKELIKTYKDSGVKTDHIPLILIGLLGLHSFAADQSPKDFLEELTNAGLRQTDINKGFLCTLTLMKQCGL